MTNGNGNGHRQEKVPTLLLFFSDQVLENLNIRKEKS